uniref:Uncharacterized protein n=1 Tax=Arundo donax TaxID=35708 RepID=A0A0A8YZD8_ARUDO
MEEGPPSTALVNDCMVTGSGAMMDQSMVSMLTIFGL